MWKQDVYAIEEERRRLEEERMRLEEAKRRLQKERTLRSPKMEGSGHVDDHFGFDNHNAKLREETERLLREETMYVVTNLSLTLWRRLQEKMQHQQQQGSPVGHTRVSRAMSTPQKSRTLARAAGEPWVFFLFLIPHLHVFICFYVEFKETTFFYFHVY